MTNQEQLTTREIAYHCHVTQRTVVQWINDGKIKCYRTPGNHTRVKKEDFISFLERYNMPLPEEFDSEDIKNKILIVDDDKNMAFSIKRAIRISRPDFLVETALDGFDAGRKLLLFKPNLIILDIRMPGLSGYDVAEKIKNSPEGVGTKIIAISAFFEEDGKERILKLGADYCMDKPFPEHDLLDKIDAVFTELQ